MDVRERKREFLKLFRLADKKYGKSSYRLAGEGWDSDWKLLITTVLSAQSRDETTIPIAEALFKRFDTLEKLSKARFDSVFKILRSMNYNKTKTKHVIAAAKFILKEFNGKVPDEIDELVRIPGVGRKTANLVSSEWHKKPSITIDTHCHRILNVFDIVNTKSADQTESEMRKVAPKRIWSRINRLLVLWGKDCPGRDKEKLLSKLNEKS